MERGDFSRSASFSLWAPLLALAILTAAVRLPFFDEPPGRDQGLFMTEAQLLSAGGRLYADVWEHKQPGIVSLYRAAMGSFGDGYAAIQLLHALAGFTTAALLVLLFRRVGCSAFAGVSAGAFYLLIYGGPIFGGFWATAQAEIFVDPCVAAALLWLLPRGSAKGSSEAPASRVALLAAGVALGSAVFWLKYSAVPLLALAPLASWPAARRGDEASSAVREGSERLIAIAVVALGVSIPPTLMLLYFSWGDRVGEFWHATVAFNVTHSRVAAFHPDGAARWIGLLLIRPAELAALYIFSALALCGRIIQPPDRRTRSARRSHDRLLVAGSALWLLALAQVVLQGKFWVYHYHVVLLPLSITAALGMEWFRDRLAERIGGRPASGLTAAIALALLWPHASLVKEYADAHRLSESWQTGLTREAFLASYRWGGEDYDAAENRAVAARVADTTQSGDAIFVWGFEPSIYLDSGRAPASRFLYDYPLMPELGPIHEQHVEWLMDDLQASEPALFLIVQRDRNDLESSDSAAQLRALAPLRAFLARHYRPLWEQGDFSAFQRKEDPADQPKKLEQRH